MHDDYNKGMYSDEKIASEWIAWIESIPKEDRDEVRAQAIYPWLSSWIKESRPRTVLEIGSGQGVCSEYVDFGDAQYIGVEPSRHLRARAKYLYPGRNFRSGQAENLPIKTASIDAAFSVFVWFHISDIEKASSELARILKPGGSFAIVSANPDQYDLWKSWHTNVRMKGKELRGNMERLSEDIMYLHSEEEIKQALTNQGLTIANRYECGYRDHKSDGDPGFVLIISGKKKNV